MPTPTVRDPEGGADSLKVVFLIPEKEVLELPRLAMKRLEWLEHPKTYVETVPMVYLIPKREVILPMVYLMPREVIPPITRTLAP